MQTNQGVTTAEAVARGLADMFKRGVGRRFHDVHVFAGGRSEPEVHFRDARDTDIRLVVRIGGEGHP